MDTGVVGDIGDHAYLNVDKESKSERDIAIILCQKMAENLVMLGYQKKVVLAVLKVVSLMILSSKRFFMLVFS